MELHNGKHSGIHWELAVISRLNGSKKTYCALHGSGLKYTTMYREQWT